MSTRTLVTTDLDRTLIYTRGAAGDAAFAAHETVCVEDYQGAPLSYMTTRCWETLDRLRALAESVPTTTRTPEQYRRVRLPGPTPRYAVTSNGGAILVRGREDPQWRTVIEDRIGALPARLDEVVAALAGRIDDDWAPRLRVADGLFCYLVVETDRQPADFLSRWRAHCAPLGWDVSQQGRKIYTVPLPVTKETALAEVRRRLVADGVLAPAARVIAAGDGLLDLGMLRAADAAIRPRHGELELGGHLFPGLTVTSGTGLAAGEEIADWFARQAAATAAVPVAAAAPPLDPLDAPSIDDHQEPPCQP